MKRFLTVTIATLVLIAPLAAHSEARPGGSSARIRPALFHDRAPRPHLHIIQPHH